MLSPFEIQDTPISLERFPIAQVNRSLQAWDAADEYILNYLVKNKIINDKSNVLVFNDSFGALSTNLTHCNSYYVNDSYLSQQGIKYNLQQNDLSDKNCTLLNSLDTLPTNIDVVLYKIPKTKALLIHQLIEIKKALNKNVLFIAADKAKEIHSSTLKVFEKYLGSTTTSLAVKKARLVFCKLDNNDTHTSPFPTCWSLENTNFSMSNHANVYAREKLDIGARYFIENLPKIPAGSTVIDLACGNGVIGLSILAKENDIMITFVDESFMAIESAKENVTNNLPNTLKNCQFMINDCLTDVDSNSVDFILCNPPFHQQTATTDHIAWQMFKDSYRVLKKGGELRIIGNRQLAYHIKLKRLFGNERLIASNNKFVTLSSIK